MTLGACSLNFKISDSRSGGNRHGETGFATLMLDFKMVEMRSETREGIKMMVGMGRKKRLVHGPIMTNCRSRAP